MKEKRLNHRRDVVNNFRWYPNRGVGGPERARHSMEPDYAEGMPLALAVRYPAYRRHDPYSGSFIEQGNLNVSCKEKRTKTQRASLKVSILHLGADEVVVVMKSQISK